MTGGQVFTRRVTVGTSPTLLTSAVRSRGAVEIQQDDVIDVFCGGADVAASGATKGRRLVALGTATDPPTPPDSFGEAVTSKGGWYGIVASGTGHVVVIEVY